MEDTLISYLLEQCSGLIIAVILIFKIEGKLDTLTESINNLSQVLIKEISKK